MDTGISDIPPSLRLFGMRHVFPRFISIGAAERDPQSMLKLHPAEQSKVIDRPERSSGWPPCTRAAASAIAAARQRHLSYHRRSPPNMLLAMSSTFWRRIAVP